MSGITRHDVSEIQNPDDSEIVRYPEAQHEILKKRFEAQAERIMVHTNPWFEKTVNDALGKIKHMLLWKL